MGTSMPGMSSAGGGAGGVPTSSPGGGVGSLDMGGQQFAGLMGQGGFLGQLPKLLQGILGNQGGAVPAQPHSQGGPAMASPGGPGGQRPGEQGINAGLQVAGMIPGPQQPFVQLGAQLAPFIEHLFGR